MINEINEASDDLKSEVVSAYALNTWFSKNDVTVIAIFPVEHTYVLVVYTDREAIPEKEVKGFGVEQMKVRGLGD